MVSRLKFPIQPLVNEMLDQLPVDVWTSSTTTFLDPAIGGGQFLVEIQRRLRAAGHSDENIAERMYGCETNILRVNYSRNNKKLVSNHLVISDFLSHDWKDMKFDVIVGNPPYQSNTATTKKLWPLFVQNSMQLCKAGGYLGMITPAAWISRPDGKANALVTKTVFVPNYLKWVDTTASKYFEIGESVTGWLCAKEPSDGRLTEVITSNGNTYINYDGSQIALSKDQELAYSIMRVIEQHNGPTLRNNVYNDVITSISIEEHVKRGIMYEKNSKLRVPVFWTASNTDQYFMNQKDVKEGIKVIVNVSGYYYSDTEPNKYMLIDQSMNYAVGAGALGITCSTVKQATNVVSLLKSKLYQFYINNEKTSGFNTGIIKLPFLDTKKKWDDKSVYAYFSLSQDQIDFVENNYSKKVA